jgi:hypothetical protein
MSNTAGGSRLYFYQGSPQVRPLPLKMSKLQVPRRGIRKHYRKEYVDKGMEHYETRSREQQIKWLTKQAQELKLQLIPA